MALECTDPGRWGAVPGFDADEETVSEYLAHLDECAYHARAERDADERIASAARVARAPVRGQAIVLTGSLAAQANARLETRRRALAHAVIRELSVRVEGVEGARTSVEGTTRVEVAAPERSVVSVWSVGNTGEQSELFLGSWIVSGDRPPRTATVLAGGERISFEILPRSGDSARVAVVFAPSAMPKPMSTAEDSSSPGLVGRISRALAGTGGWAPAYGLAAAALAVAVVAPFYFQRGAPEPSVASAVDEPAPPGLPTTPDTEPGPGPEAAGAASNRARPPILRTPPKTRRVPRTPAPEMTLAAVRRIYIQNESGDPALRDTFANELSATGRYKIVDSPHGADAKLRLSRTRGLSAQVAVSLDDAADRNLWNANVTVPGNGAAKAAADFVREFVKAVDDESKPQK
jgi:hypothetical protein